MACSFTAQQHTASPANCSAAHCVSKAQFIPHQVVCVPSRRTRAPPFLDTQCIPLEVCSTTATTKSSTQTAPPKKVAVVAYCTLTVLAVTAVYANNVILQAKKSKWSNHRKASNHQPQLNGLMEGLSFMYHTSASWASEHDVLVLDAGSTGQPRVSIVGTPTWQCCNPQLVQHAASLSLTDCLSACLGHCR